MSDEIQKTALRLPKSLHEAIHAAAKESGRTMNAEIVYRLQQSFEANRKPGNFDVFNGMQFKNLKLSLDKSSADKFSELLVRIANVIQDQGESDAGDGLNDYDLSASKDIPGYGDFK